MIHIKLACFYFIGILFLSSIIALFTTFTLVSFLNSLFLFSLFILIIGGFLLVLQGGLFNGFIYSFRRFLKKSSRHHEWVSEHDVQSDYPNYSFPFLPPLLIAVVMSLLFSIFLSYFI